MEKGMGKWLRLDSACQAHLRPESQNPHKKTSTVAHACNASLGDAEMEGSLGLGGQLILLNLWAPSPSDWHLFSTCMGTNIHLHTHTHSPSVSLKLMAFQSPRKSEKCDSVNSLVKGFGKIYNTRHEVPPVKQTSYQARKQLVAPIMFMPLVH